MRLPNLLTTPRGRLVAFFFLYLTEGIPLGFAATAVATQLRRQDVGPAAIGAFVASFYLPWAFKWAFGPVIDVFASKRFGHRRGWILLTQTLMTLTLLSTVLLKLPEQLALFTVILLVHNTFGAMQDVAIDALAVSVLEEHERGLANGVMFGGASLGQAVGGSGVLFLSAYTGFQATFWFVAACLMAVAAFVVLPMREPAMVARAAVIGSKAADAGRRMRDFAIDAFRSFLGSRGAFTGMLYSLLPIGAMCLGLALQSNLAVELGMDDDQVAWLNLWSTLINGVCCVLGGWLSDRYGRRPTLAVFTALMSLPVVYLAYELQRVGWVMPVSVNAANRPVVPAALLFAFWVATLVYNVFNGLMYGIHTALLMDVTNPKVAATQFTAYMAMMNLAISYSATWQGIAIEAWGYPKTMLVDAVFGLSGLLLIPFVKPAAGGFVASDAGAPARARGLAFALGLLCLAWVPYRLEQDLFGAAQPIAGTVFTLIFVGSALFLLAAGAVLGGSAQRLARIGMWGAPLLLLMHLRYHAASIAGWFGGGAGSATFSRAAEWYFLGVPLVGGIVLLTLALRGWGELRVAQMPVAAVG